MKCFVFLSVFYLSAFIVIAQEDVEVTTNKKDTVSIRDQYIQRYPDHFFIWPVLKQRSLSFDVENLKGSKDKLTFKPNNAYTLGLGVYMFDVGVEVTFAVPVDQKSKAKFGTTHAKDFQINALSKKFGFDIYNQKYSGYYQTDSKVKIPQGSPFPQRSDIVTKNFGLSGFYILRDKKFSIKSAYNFAERQLHRRGSILIVGALNAFKLTADSAVLPYNYRKSFTEGSAFDKLKYTTFSIAPGYSYSFIFKHFFLNGTLVLGPAHNWIYYHEPDGHIKHDITINAYSSVRVAIGYNSDKFFGGITFVTQSRNVRFEDIKFTNSSTTFRLLVGYRFKERGFLKKSILDIPREFMKLTN